MDEEQAIYTCEYCGYKFEKGNEENYKEHVERCFRRFGDKDIRTALIKLKRFCKEQEHCHRCKYWRERLMKCFFDNSPSYWSIDL